ncbi:hypothetical protein TNCV_3496241 [Trichonephila clavipes]|nr:hypothetical protein TNCV_3496241 [Trichonephila clavipes]
MKPSDLAVAYRASTGRGLKPRSEQGQRSLSWVFSGSINKYQACLMTKRWGFYLQTDHLAETSAHAPQCPRS